MVATTTSSSPERKCALDALAGGAVKAGVVGGGTFTEGGGELVGSLAGGRVDDGGAAFGRQEEVADEAGALRFGHLDGFDGEVGAAEAVDEEGGRLEAELGDDVALDCRGGGSGEGEDGGGAELWKIFAEGSVVRAEVVSPGGDAVCFINRY